MAAHLPGVAIALWLVAATLWPIVFATPKQVLDAFIDKAASGVLWGHVWASLSRVLLRLCDCLCGIHPGGLPHGLV